MDKEQIKAKAGKVVANWDYMSCGHGEFSKSQGDVLAELIEKFGLEMYEAGRKSAFLESVKLFNECGCWDGCPGCNTVKPLIQVKVQESGENQKK